MQTQKIVLFPPTHEISTPSFHVVRDLSDSFVTFLAVGGISVTEEPVPVGDESSLVEIRAEADTPIRELERLMFRFLERQGPASDAT